VPRFTLFFNNSEKDRLEKLAEEAGYSSVYALLKDLALQELKRHE